MTSATERLARVVRFKDALDPVEVLATFKEKASDRVTEAVEKFVGMEHDDRLRFLAYAILSLNKTIMLFLHEQKDAEEHAMRVLQSLQMQEQPDDDDVKPVDVPPRFKQ